MFYFATLMLLMLLFVVYLFVESHKNSKRVI